MRTLTKSLSFLLLFCSLNLSYSSTSVTHENWSPEIMSDLSTGIVNAKVKELGEFDSIGAKK